MTSPAQSIQIPVAPAMSCDLPDDILVTNAIDGDSPSFEVLIRRYQRAILAVGRRMTGSFADAEDIAQQTFMKAFVALPRFQRRCSFSTWLTTIAINEARMWRRKKSRLRELLHPGVQGEENAAPALEIADSKPDPESSYSEKERRMALLSRVTQLNPSSRVVLQVCDLQEESTKAAALLLGVTVTAVKSRRSRGRAVLRRALARYRPQAAEKVKP
jgi:RNA polymerase sigma-70 factor, ECF subfamily